MFMPPSTSTWMPRTLRAEHSKRGLTAYSVPILLAFFLLASFYSMCDFLKGLIAWLVHAQFIFPLSPLLCNLNVFLLPSIKVLYLVQCLFVRNLTYLYNCASIFIEVVISFACALTEKLCRFLSTLVQIYFYCKLYCFSCAFVEYLRSLLGMTMSHYSRPACILSTSIAYVLLNSRTSVTKLKLGLLENFSRGGSFLAFCPLYFPVF